MLLLSQVSSHRSLWGIVTVLAEGLARLCRLRIYEVEQRLLNAGLGAD